MEQLVSGVRFTSSGSTILDLALGGGWAMGRMANIVGDRSSGKSLLAIEAMANHSIVYPDGLRRYGEAEAAYDIAYGQNLGMPGDVEVPEDLLDTVEDFHNDLEAFAKRCIRAMQPGMYVLDSADALSSRAELDRAIDAATFGAEKAKMFSQLFRRQVRMIKEADVSLIIISQVREDIGATYGDGLTRSGGKALDFYASQIPWLKHTGQIKKTVRGQDRIVGVDIGAKLKKNKVGYPFREADFPIIFGYGLDDEKSMLNWLKELNSSSQSKAAKSALDVIASWGTELQTLRENGDREGVRKLANELKAWVTKDWWEIEKAIAPTTRKYGMQGTPAPMPTPAPLPIRS